MDNAAVVEDYGAVAYALELVDQMRREQYRRVLLTTDVCLNLFEGRIGNAIFRCFSLIGWDGYVSGRRTGFPFMYVESSRNTVDYFPVIEEAAATVNNKKLKES